MLTRHGITDRAKCEQIKESLKVNGWVGVPLVLADENGGNLITGTHRYCAAIELGWSDNDIPVISLAEVFEEVGKSYQLVASGWDYPTLFEPIFEQMINAELSQDILDKYGIQLG